MNKQKKRPSIRRTLVISLFLLCAITILILWLCQNLFLNDIYKSIKTSELKEAKEKITRRIAAGELETAAQDLANEYELCVVILSENNQFTSVSLHTTGECVLHQIDTMGYMILYNQAIKSQNGILYYVKDENANRYVQTQKNEKGEQSIVLVSTAPYQEGQAILFLNMVISPVGATVKTLNTILLYVTIVLILLSVLLSFIISHMIAKPIVSINNSAAQLAKGNYNIEFKGSGYAEADQLAYTLNYAEAELSKVDQLQKELIANISHDLRTPLTMISGYSQIMKDLPGENTPENLQIIIDETERLTSLVNDVLDISKLHSGAQRFEMKQLCLTTITEKAMQRYAKLIAGGYQISFSHGENLLIMGDETRVLQVIYNLVNNAVTYTGDDKKVTLIEERRGEFARLSVIDTGDGIPQDKLNDIWERYYKVDQMHKRYAIGSGLGLSIVREIMEEHGGRYGVISTPGTGSEFWVEFRIASDDEPPSM
ncbi:MAG: HAMP domain-containing histidine kinase [Clostridiales bacterium]|nr:HAMP domain-containing histidine kinase [Clostridiales bacterium]